MNTQSSITLSDWLVSQSFGRYLRQRESDFLAVRLARMPLPTILQLGINLRIQAALPDGVQWLQQRSPQDAAAGKTDVVALPTALPWQNQSINTVICLHGFDHMTAAQLTPAIREIHRVLQPGGQMVVTGLNAGGYWRLFYPPSRFSGNLQPHTASHLTRLCQQCGLTLSEGCFMGYGLPFCHSNGTPRRKPAIEYMGNRWWPHLAALYGLVLTRQTIPLTPRSVLKPAFTPNGVLGLRAAQRNLK